MNLKNGHALTKASILIVCMLERFIVIGWDGVDTYALCSTE